MPESVSLVVAARMAQLSPAARELVNLLGVGEQLEPAALSLAMGVTEAGFVTAVEEAMAAGLVAQAPGGPCQFTHELTRTAVCAALSAPRAGLLHGVVADALRAADPAVMRSRPYAVAAHLDVGRAAGRAAGAFRRGRGRGRRTRPGTPSPGSPTRRRSPGTSGGSELAEHVPAISQERRAELLVDCGRTMWLASHPDAGTTLLRRRGAGPGLSPARPRRRRRARR